VQADRQTGRQEDRQTGRQEDRQTGRQQADRQTGRQADRQSGRQADSRQTGRQQADRQTGRLLKIATIVWREKQTDRQEKGIQAGSVPSCPQACGQTSRKLGMKAA
jgi:hypothetical protein